MCGPGWTGTGCSAVVIPVATGAPACSGVVDVNGVCCTSGVVDSATGGCCESGVAVDASGQCCGADEAVDACGVCGGSGVVVDVFGACCSSSLPPSGQCCVSGNVDACGVCDGTNACEMSLTAMVVWPSAGWNESVVSVESLADVLDVPTSDIFNDSVTVVADAAGLESGSGSGSGSGSNSVGPSFCDCAVGVGEDAGGGVPLMVLSH